MIDIKKAVDRFLCWKLPEHFSPDCGISFTREYNQNTPYHAKHEPVGTNLFTAEQARAMFEHCLQDTLERIQKAEAGLPVEPQRWTIDDGIKVIGGPYVKAEDYDTLRVYAAQMKEKADNWQRRGELADLQKLIADATTKRAEKAEEERDIAVEMHENEFRKLKQAEAENAALREWSKGLWYLLHGDTQHFDVAAQSAIDQARKP